MYVVNIGQHSVTKKTMQTKQGDLVLPYPTIRQRKKLPIKHIQSLWGQNGHVKTIHAFWKQIKS